MRKAVTGTEAVFSPAKCLALLGNHLCAVQGGRAGAAAWQASAAPQVPAGSSAGLLLNLQQGHHGADGGGIKIRLYRNDVLTGSA